MRRKQWIYTAAFIVTAIAVVVAWDLSLGNKFVSVAGTVEALDGTPIAGATVRVRVQSFAFWQAPAFVAFKDMSASSTIKSVQTNERGEFSIGRTRGYSITVLGIEKQGFYRQWVNDERALFNWNHGDSSGGGWTARGSRFVLASCGEVRASESGAGYLWVRPNGDPVILALPHRKAADQKCLTLQLRLTSDVDGMRARSRQFSCALEVTTVGCAIEETADCVPQLAPEGGYGSNWRFETLPDAENSVNGKQVWTGGLRRYFYLRSTGGQCYGWIQLVVTPVIPGDNRAKVAYTYAANLDGSRAVYVEPDRFELIRGQRTNHNSRQR